MVRPMRTVMIIAAAAALTLPACKKADNKKKPAPAAAKTTDDKDTADKKAAEPAAELTVTTKSPEAKAEFEKGRDLVDNLRAPNSFPHFQKAIELDADFALAHAYLGRNSMGPEGVTHLEKAVSLAATLPEAERTVIEAMHQARTGEAAKARASWKKAAELAPGEWRLHVHLGSEANRMMSHDAALSHFEAAQKLKPDLAVVHNGLAYAHAGKGAWEPAIAAARKQVELLPKEPNPQDTLGEILLQAGKLDEAEKAFEAALAIDPTYGIAWQGVALARGYRGDLKGALEATAKGLAGAPAHFKGDIVIETAWVKLAAGKGAEAIKDLTALEKDPAVQKMPAMAFAAIERGFILAEMGKHADATKAFTAGLAHAQTLSGDVRTNATRAHALGTLRSAALAGKPAADADKLVAAIEGEASAQPDNTGLQGGLAWARGLVAWAKDGSKAAVAELSKCPVTSLHCRYDLSVAQRKAGDAAAADATAKEIGETQVRESAALYIRTLATKK